MSTILVCDTCGREGNKGGRIICDPKASAEDLRKGKVVFFESRDGNIHICSTCIQSAADFIKKALKK